ncbi:MAG: polysaccharide biosynthesis tyrosine autokinase [Verrucomicrobia bacterium]|nr:polysaccharide biosynthesis tyrosine autokinase [Verrucomicrobiota bacterium]
MEENSNPPTPRPVGTPSDSHQIRRYWLMLVERRWLVFCTFTLIVALGALYAFKASPVYEAVGRVQIDPEAGGMLSMRDNLMWGVKDQDYLQTQYRALLSPTLVEAVIQKLKLDEDPRYALAEDRIRAVTQDLDVEPIRLTRFVIVRARHPDPKRAADMVNTLMDVYLRQNQDRKTEKAYSGLALLKQEADQAERELAKAMTDLHDYRVEKRMISLVDEMKQAENVDLQALRNAQDEFGRQSSQTAAAEKVAEQAEKWRSQGRDISGFFAVSQDPLVNQLKARIADAESKLAGLRSRYKDMHPTVEPVLKGLERDRQSLTNEARRAFEEIFTQVQVETSKLAVARKQREDAEKRITDLNAARTGYDLLNRKKARIEDYYQRILTRMKEYTLDTKDTQRNILIDFRAVPQPHYVKPNRKLILAASIIAGLLASLGLAFFVNLLDDSIKSQEDVENFLGVSFLGYVPRIKEKDVAARGLHTHLQPTSTAAEGFRTMRAAVALGRNSEKLRSIAVSSTIPEEGKSLFACNYAIVTAQTGVKTLLVDADLRRPSVQKAFKLPSTAGLSAYLSESVRNVEEIVNTTEIPNLSVVCCGKLPANPSELLASPRMRQFLREATQHYDRVIVDCAPVSAVADPLILGALTDGMIFVTKFNKVRRDTVLRSVQRVQDAGIQLVGVVINDIDFEGRHAYYGDYHYHQNKYYASHYADRTESEPDRKTPRPREAAKS